MMRRLPIVTSILIGLSACASVPSSNDVSIRTASWQGAPADELIAILGEPNISKKGNMTWRFLEPRQSHTGRYQHRSTDSRSLSVLTGCAGCSEAGSVGSVVTPGTHIRGRSGGATTPHFCTYLAYVENGTVSRLITLGNSRTRCRFDELPLRSTD